MRRILFASVCSVTLVALGCGGSISVQNDPGADAAIDAAPADGTPIDAIGPGPGPCTPDRCGPATGTPAMLCADGTYGGNTGRCIATYDGLCTWENRPCPPAKSCKAGDSSCDASHYCKLPRGKCGEVGVCFIKPTGTCTSGGSICGCDGKTHSGECEAAKTGTSVAYDGVCETTVSSCGGPSGIKCKNALDYCKLEAGACISPDPSIPFGTCTAKPSGCTDIYDPVCSCEGKTYGNPCDAASVGANVAYKGTCKGPPPGSKTCGGFIGAVCSDKEWCDYPDGSMCGAGDVSGLCKPRPEGCSKELNPVCGCDGTTYGNPCLAQAAGQDVIAKGPCK